MINNPFRGERSINVQQNVEDWGKSKFKPNKFVNGGKNPFKKHSSAPDDKPFNGNLDNRKGTNFCKNKETYKFNEVVRDPRPENATPWNKYKNEIVFKQREEEQAALQANMESSEAKIILKQREINYRKSLMEQKKREPTKWEDFNDDKKVHQKSKNKSNKFSDIEIFKPKENLKRNHMNKSQKHTNSKLNTQSKTKFKKNVSNPISRTNVKEFISNDLLENFDGKKLSYKQKNKLRGVITKTVNMVTGGSLENVVKDMKRQKIKEKNKK